MRSDLQMLGSWTFCTAVLLKYVEVCEKMVHSLANTLLQSKLKLPEQVIFQFVERPTIRYVRYVGASLRRNTLEKQAGIKVGDSIDPYLVEESRRKLEEYYKSKGFAKAPTTSITTDSTSANA